MADPLPLAPLPNTGTIADTIEPLPVLRPVTPTRAPIVDPASLSDVFHASDVLARQDNPTASEVRLRNGYAPVLEALGLPSSDNPANFYDLDPQTAARMGPMYQPSTVAKQSAGGVSFYGADNMADRPTQERLIADQIKLHRQKDPNFLKGVPDTVDGLHDYFVAAEKAKRGEAQATLANAPGGISSLGAQIAGGVYGGFHDPANLATLAIPGGPGKTLLQIAARDALINGAIELVEQPIVAQNRADLGEHLTLGEAATNVATAAAGGAVLGGAIHVGGKLVAATGIPTKIGQVVGSMSDQARAYWGPKIGNGVQAAKDFASSLSNSDLVRFSRDATGGKLTPDQSAAANVLERSQEVGATSPYQPGPVGDGTHESGLAGALKDLEDGRAPHGDGMTIGSYVDAYIRGEGRSDPAMEQFAANNAPAIEAEFQRRAQSAGVGRPPEALSTSRRPQPVGDAAIESFKAKVGGAENATGNVNARNPRSSASGPVQITDPTFRSYYKRLTGTDPGKHPAQAIKNDPAMQHRILDTMTRDNANTLGSLGESVNDGNLYVMHVFGPGDGAKLFKSAPDAPIERVLSADVLNANPFLKGKSASQAIAWAHEKMGRAVSSVGARPGFASNLDPASEDPAIAQLRAEALQLDNAVIGVTRLPDGTPVNLHAVRVPASSILVDAERFQFKSGGDAQGVTDRLHGLEEWDPGRAGRVGLWEDIEGRLFAADGHQRVGLANRVGHAQGVDIPIDAMVLRERDGVTAEDARTWAALKNIAEGTGSPIDAAKVARSAGVEALHSLPPKSALVRDAGALARLSDEAFGAVYNGVIPPDYAAVIGHLLPDRPDAHAAMVDLLVKLDPPNRGQAESIVRQGMAAGLHVEHQDELFGSRELVSSLMLERAKVLEKGLAKIRRLGLVHKTAATEKATLEAVGSTIAAERSAKEAKANVEAAEIVSRLAFSRGPVADALNAAAEKLAGGARLSDVVDQFAADVRKLDLAAVSRAAPVDNGGGASLDGSGRGSDAGEAGAAVSAQPGDPGKPELDEPTLGDLLAATERFSDPDGKAVHQQAESLEHDLKAELDPATAAAAFEHDFIQSVAWEPFDRATATDAYLNESDALDIIQHVLDNHAVATGRDLTLSEAEHAKIYKEIHQILKGTNNAEAATRVAEKALKDGRIKVEDNGAPPVAEPKPLPPSTLIPEPVNARKSADYAGSFVPQEQAKASLEGWKAEAKRIGTESPPPPNHVILSLFDASGRWSQPYRDMGYKVVQLDAKHGVDVIGDISHIQIKIDELRAQGFHFAGVIAQPPCTTFTVSGARWWEPRHNRQWASAVRKMFGAEAANLFDTPVEYNQFLVATSEEFIARAKPDFFVLENPVGRIEKLAGLPKPLLQIEPHHFGDPYTKKTNLWGSFNNELPTANVDPVEGSRMHKLRSSAEKDGGLRSLTPEGFAYAFALANRPGTEAADRVVAGALDHGAAVDPAIAERQRQEVALRAASPLRPGAVDAKSEIGLPLMDVADQFGFRLEEEGGTVKPQDLLDELDADAKAIQAMKDCL